eukprot:11066393-Ditylum_brightwellii.AAC.2
MQTRRYYCTAAVLDGLLYVVEGYDHKNEKLLSAEIILVGGYDGNTAHTECEAYNSTTCQWSSIPSMQTGCYGCAAVEMDGTLYVMGCIDGTNNYLSSIETLDTL